jgi:hypothetical protein
MKADPDAIRLLSLLVAICGPDEIASCRPKIEALVATRKANARLIGEVPAGLPPSVAGEQ